MRRMSVMSLALLAAASSFAFAQDKKSATPESTSNNGNTVTVTLTVVQPIVMVYYMSADGNHPVYKEQNDGIAAMQAAYDAREEEFPWDRCDLNSPKGRTVFEKYVRERDQYIAPLFKGGVLVQRVWRMSDNRIVPDAHPLMLISTRASEITAYLNKTQIPPDPIQVEVEKSSNRLAVKTVPLQASAKGSKAIRTDSQTPRPSTPTAAAAPSTPAAPATLTTASANTGSGPTK